MRHLLLTLPLWALLTACDPEIQRYPVESPREVLVIPGSFYVTVGAQKILSAVVAGDSSGDVNWQVEEGGGSVLPNGLYSAPTIAGQYRVTARSRLHPKSLGEGTAVVVDPPTSPLLTTDSTTVTVGATMMVRVQDPKADLIYDWTVQNGELLSNPRGTEIQYRAQQTGFVAVVCNVQNAAGDTTRPTTLFIDVVAPLPNDALPQLLAPVSVKQGRAFLRASVENPKPELGYEWTISNGTITQGEGTSAIQLTAGEVGEMRLTVRATTSAGLKSDEVEALVTVVQGADAVVLVGTPGGVGLAGGIASDARLSLPRMLASDAAGNVYVENTDSSFGSVRGFRGSYAGISRIHPDGRVSLLGRGSPELEPSAFTATSVGDLYVVVENDNDEIVLLHANRDDAPSGTFDEMAVLGDDDSDFYYTRALASDAAGVLYLATRAAVWRLEGPSYTPELVAGDESEQDCLEGNELTARFSDIRSLAVDPNDPTTLYVADLGNQRVRTITITGFSPITATVSTSAGVDCSSSDDPAFSYPYGVVVDAVGNVFVTDAADGSSGIDQVWVLPSTAPTIPKLVAGPTTAVAEDPWYRDGVGHQARFNYLRGVAVVATGTVVVADQDNHVVRRISAIDSAQADPADTSLVNTFAGKTGAWQEFELADSNLCTDRTATAPRLVGAVAVDRTGRVVFGDRGNCRLRQIDRAEEVSVFSGSGFDGYFGIDNGLPYYASFSVGIEDIIALPDGSFALTENVFGSAAGTFYRQIRHISATGLVTNLAGDFTGNANCSYPDQYVDSKGSDARFCSLRGIDVNPEDGMLFVADGDVNSSLRAVLPDASVITVGYYPGLLLNKVGPLAVARDGALLFANTTSPFSEEYVIETVKYSPSAEPIRMRIAGSEGGQTNDGPCLSAGFRSVTGFAYDRDDDTLYIADYNLVRRVRHVSDAALCVVDTVAGVRGERGFIAGSLPARFNRVRDVALTPARDLVVTDEIENLVVLLRI
jgi:hypothetical protein